jgi:hypothetical protein
MSQYIFSLSLSIVNNKALLQINSEIHNNTRYNSKFHRTLVNLTTYKNGTYYTDIKIFKYLPNHIKNVSHNINQFRLALSDYLNLHPFYNLEEYFNNSSTLWTYIISENTTF